MKLTGETKFFIGVIILTLILVIGGVIFMSRPPKPVDRALLIPPNPTATGSAQAKVTLVEFSDYQCPACKSFSPIVKQLTEKYPQQLYFVYRHYPLPQYPMSKSAAIAAEAARKQDKFWQMHDLLFRYNDELSPAKYIDLATQLNLDLDQFNLDSTSSAVSSRVDKDISDGNLLNIIETPTFFLNGVKLNLMSVGDLSKSVDKAISESK